MKRKTSFFLAAVLLLSLFTACGGKEDEPPATYAIGDDEVVSLDSIIDEGAAVLSAVEEPTEAAIAMGEEQYVYHYRQMVDPAEMAGEYIRVLCGTEQGFVMTDEGNQQLAEEPNLEVLSGQVILEKKSATEPAEGESAKIFQVAVVWSEFSIAIRTSHQEGTILPPPVPEEEEQPVVTAVMEQMDFFNSLQPRDIGLEGDNMGDYMVYPKEGWVLVDSFSCRELTVYLEDARDGTNVFMGTYYLSSDLTHLYQRTTDGAIVSIDLKK